MFLRQIAHTVQAYDVLPPKNMINITISGVCQFILFLLNTCLVSTNLLISLRSQSWSISWPFLCGIILFCKKRCTWQCSLDSPSYPERVIPRQVVLISVDSTCFCVCIQIRVSLHKESGNLNFICCVYRVLQCCFVLSTNLTLSHRFPGQCVAGTNVRLDRSKRNFRF